MATASQTEDRLDLQIRRRRLGVHQIPLAIALGVHQGTLSRFETGQRPDLPGKRGVKEYLDALDALCKAQVA